MMRTAKYMTSWWFEPLIRLIIFLLFAQSCFSFFIFLFFAAILSIFVKFKLNEICAKKKINDSDQWLKPPICRVLRCVYHSVELLNFN